MLLHPTVKEARTRKGLTQPELANLVGCTRVQISIWENQHAMPHAANRRRVEEVLATKINWQPDAPLDALENRAVLVMLKDAMQRNSDPDLLLNKRPSELRQMISDLGYLDYDPPSPLFGCMESDINEYIKRRETK